MTSFQVDTSTLEALSSRLASVRAQMPGPEDGSSDGAATALCSHEAFLALQDFHDSWSQGLATMSGSIAAMTKQLLVAGQAYITAEGAIRHAVQERT